MGDLPGESIYPERLIADLLFPLCISTRLTFIIEIAHPKYRLQLQLTRCFLRIMSFVKTNKLMILKKYKNILSVEF